MLLCYSSVKHERRIAPASTVAEFWIATLIGLKNRIIIENKNQTKCVGYLFVYKINWPLKKNIREAQTKYNWYVFILETFKIFLE